MMGPYLLTLRLLAKIRWENASDTTVRTDVVLRELSIARVGVILGMKKRMVRLPPLRSYSFRVC